MGRLALSEAFRKDERLMIRLTGAEKKMLGELTEAQGTNASNYIRKVIADEYILFLTGKKS